MSSTQDSAEYWEEQGYEQGRGRRGGPNGVVLGPEEKTHWLAGAERAGRKACAEGEDLETEAAKIEDIDTRIAFRKGYLDGAPDRFRAVPALEDSHVTERSLPEKLPNGIAATLTERGKRYGAFRDQAVYADRINDVLTSSPNWEKMAPDQREALRIIANKIGRILNGDPDYADSWHDIVGYAKLVDDRLMENEKEI